MQALEELHLTPLEECPSDTNCSIDDLRRQEAALSETAIKLESEHKELFSRHHANLKKLHQFRTQLDELRQQFQSINQEYETLAIQNNELVLQLTAVTENRRNQLAALQDIRQAIQNLTKIVICVYSDGRIEPLDNAEFIPDETGYDTTYHSLLKQENCQDLRLCDIKLIARVKAIIDNSVQPIEPLFEDAKLESHYFS